MVSAWTREMKDDNGGCEPFKHAGQHFSSTVMSVTYRMHNRNAKHLPIRMLIAACAFGRLMPTLDLFVYKIHWICIRILFKRILTID